MDLRDPNFIKSLIDGERQRQTEERLSHLDRTSASGQIRALQGGMFDLAEGKLPAPVLGVARAGLEGVTQVLDKVFNLGPRETQIQTAKDMASMAAIDAVNRIRRQVAMDERIAMTKEMLAREGVGSLAELRARQRMGRR